MNHTSTTMRDIRPAAAEIEYKGFRFLITDRPADQTILTYVQVSEKSRYIKPLSNNVTFLNSRSFGLLLNITNYYH